MKIAPPWRKALLTLHVVTAVGWLGVDLVQLALAVTGARGSQPAVVYPALGFIGLNRTWGRTCPIRPGTTC